MKTRSSSRHASTEEEEFSQLADRYKRAGARTPILPPAPLLDQSAGRERGGEQGQGRGRFSLLPPLLLPLRIILLTGVKPVKRLAIVKHSLSPGGCSWFERLRSRRSSDDNFASPAHANGGTWGSSAGRSAGEEEEGKALPIGEPRLLRRRKDSS